MMSWKARITPLRYMYVIKAARRDVCGTWSSKEKSFEESKGRIEKDGLKIKRSVIHQYQSAEHPSKKLIIPACANVNEVSVN